MDGDPHAVPLARSLSGRLVARFEEAQKAASERRGLGREGGANRRLNAVAAFADNCFVEDRTGVDVEGGQVEAHGQEVPGRVPGVAAMTLILRGGVLQALAALCVIPIALQSLMPHGHAIAGRILLLCFALAVAGGVVTMLGYRRSAKEKAAGYTTMLGDARKDMSLMFVSPRTFRIVAAAHEPRPQRMPRD